MVNSRKKRARARSKKEGNSKRIKVKGCNICGDRGFSNALITCSKCSDTDVHLYCLGIPPRTIDDSFVWVCEFCCVQMEIQPYTSIMSGGSITGGSEERFTEHPETLKELKLKMKKRKQKLKRKQKRLALTPVSEIVPALVSTEVQAGALTVHNGKLNTEVSKHLDNILKIREKESIAVDVTGIVDEMLSYQGNMQIVLVEDQPKPLVTLLPIGHHECSERAEINYGSQTASTSLGRFSDIEESNAQVSSFMECPKEIMKGLVLLVSPSGEMIVQEVASLFDDLASSSLKTSILNLASSSSVEETVVLDEHSLGTDEDIAFGHPDSFSKIEELIDIFFGDVVDACYSKNHQVNEAA